MINRRLSRRIPFRKKVKHGSSDPSFLCYTLNISENGIGIESRKVFPPGSRIIVHIYMDGTNLEGSIMDEVIILEGVVARVSLSLPGFPSKMGIKFTSRTDDIKRVYQQQILDH
jgi:hypothetical protein